MKNVRMGALLAAALLIPRDLETKDGEGVGPEVKAAVDGLTKTFEEFKAKNDERLKQAEKRGEDAVTKDEVEKLNKGIDEAVAAIKKRQDEVEAKANRMALAGGEVGTEAKNAKAFGDLVGKSDYSVEDLAEYKSDLARYLRSNEVKVATMQVGQDPVGGYLVTPDTSGRMVQKIYESTPMRQLASVVVIGTDALEGPVDNGEADAAWIGETGTRSQTEAPTLGMWRIPVHELYAYPKVTQKLLEDARIDVEAWLADKAVNKFSRKENNAFLVGDGVNKPRGLLDYTTAATADDTRAWGQFQHVVTGADGGFGSTTNGSDKLLDLIYEVKAAYRQNGRFLAARRTLGGIRKLKDGQGNYAYGLGLKEGSLVETIFGYGVTDGEDMPAFTTTGALAVAFGDFAEAYTIVDRLGVAVVRDNVTQPGFVKYNMRKRVGGGAVNFEAVKFLKFSAS